MRVSESSQTRWPRVNRSYTIHGHTKKIRGNTTWDEQYDKFARGAAREDAQVPLEGISPGYAPVLWGIQHMGRRVQQTCTPAAREEEKGSEVLLEGGLWNSEDAGENWKNNVVSLTQ